MFYHDAHIHLAQCGPLPEDISCVSCAHSREEFFEQERCAKEGEGRVLCAFGLHPQGPDLEYAPFLEELLSEKRICAIGETGFDLYNDEFKATLPLQEKAFEVCLSLALEYCVPLIVHNRKAIDLIFRYAPRLKRVKSVVFHSFAFTPNEAASLLRHGINAYFSFGKQLLNGNKKSISCVSEIDISRILFETDAPFQTLKGERMTKPAEIRSVYERACEIRSISREELCVRVENTFKRAFFI